MEKLNFDAKLNKGSVLVIIAVLLPVFILLLGMIVDIGRALTYKEEINKACMIAAEEATKSVDIEAAENLGINVLNENFSDVIYEYFNKNYKDRGYCSINYLNYDIFDSIDNPKYIVVSCEA
ncbi:MAG: pilus assembly protein, partial [Actinobacteria bacterium]|nr:pilus assembly protein [Actinomycetota bacterium]